jgi:hypothetical protein
MDLCGYLRYAKHLGAGIGAAIWLDNSIAQENILFIGAIIGALSYVVSGEMQTYNQGQFVDYSGKGYVCAGSAFAVVYYISRDIRVSVGSAIAAYAAGYASHYLWRQQFCPKTKTGPVV